MSEALIPRSDVRVAPISKSFDEMMRVADTLLKSGFLPNQIKTAAQAVSIILMGREVGLPEMQALRSINIIQGKPTLSSELMLGLFSSRVNGEAKITKSDDTECVILFKRPGREPHTQKFTIEQAKKLGLAGKDNYFKQPATMLQWRCVSAGLRFYAPDALAGISYTPDELGAEVNPDTGEVIDLSLAREASPGDDPLGGAFGTDEPTIDLRADESLDLGELAQETREGPNASAPVPGEKTPLNVTEGPKPARPRVSEANRRFCTEMAKQKIRIGKAAYYKILGSQGFEHSWEISDRNTQKVAWDAMKLIPDYVED